MTPAWPSDDMVEAGAAALKVPGWSDAELRDAAADIVLAAMSVATPAQDYHETHRQISEGVLTYRIEAVNGGFEPQQLYTAGLVERAIWFPLNADGYWAEPDSFSTGDIKSRYPLQLKEDAERAILCARRINGERILVPLSDHQPDRGGTQDSGGRDG